MIAYPHFAVPHVVLRNGYESRDSPYGKVTSYADVEGLEQRLRLLTLEQKYLLTPQQVRFVRIGMDLTQGQFAERLRVNEQTVARWEKGRTAITPIVDLAVRVVALKVWAPNTEVRIVPINEDVKGVPGRIEMEYVGGQWRSRLHGVAETYPIEVSYFRTHVQRLVGAVIVQKNAMGGLHEQIEYIDAPHWSAEVERIFMAGDPPRIIKIKEGRAPLHDQDVEERVSG